MSQSDTAVPPTSASGSAPPGADRRTVVDQARVLWMTRLTDYSRDNNLLYHRPSRLGSWEVPDPHEFCLHQLIAGVRTAVARLSPTARLLDDCDDLTAVVAPESLPDDAVGAIRRLEHIRRRADESFEETGVETMHLAYGLATWPPFDGGDPPAAPVLLIPVTIEASLERMAIQRCADPEINLELLQLLTAWGCPAVDTGMLDELTTANSSEIGPILDRIVAAVSASSQPIVPGFAVDRRVVIGNFSHARIQLVGDLVTTGGRLAASPVIAAIAGDGSARVELARGQVSLDPARLDGRSPAEEFNIVDADGEQRAIVDLALAGRDVLVTGGPGTGKTQTIANIVAELVAAGRKVLVAIGKGAAIDAVRHHFNAAGVDGLILDLHGVVTRREFMEQFADALDAVREAPPVAETSALEELARRRDILAAHAARMNRPLPPTGMTVFFMLGALMRTSEPARTRLRFEGPALERLGPEGAQEIERLLAAEATVEDILLATNPSPWTPARLSGEADAGRAHAAAVALDAAWGQLRPSLDGVLAQTRLRPPKDLVETRALAEMVDLAGRLERRYAQGVWSLDLDDVLKGVTLGIGGGLAKAVTRATYGQYKRSHRELVAHRTGPEAAAGGEPEAIPAEALRPEVLDLIRVREVWRVDGPPGTTPRGSASLPGLLAALREFDARLPDLQKAFPGDDLHAQPLDVLPGFLRGLAEDAVTVMRVPTHCVSADRLDALEMGSMLELIVSERRPGSLWIEIFRAARVQSALEAAWAADPGMGGFDGVAHDMLVTQFARLDRDRVAVAAARLRRVYAENAVTAMNSWPEQAALVRQETAKREGIMDPERLSGAASEVMTALKPCWMVSPLEVAHQIDGNRQHFDVVVLDDANLLLPEEAVPALARARSCIVFGDTRQLPTRPLVVWRQDADADSARPPEGADNIMASLGAAMRPIRLRTDYGSADERLIALGNRTVYDGEMLTTPSPEVDLPIRLEVVTPDGEGTAEGTSAAEARRVVELVAEHARAHPDQSLGVVTLTDRHARRVEAALTLARRSDDGLDRFCIRRGEGIYVKDVSRTQGDRRDHCILSVGYGRGDGHFGALSREGGLGRANVATTRGRRRVTVVASFAATDLAPGGPPGVEHLRRFLLLAATGSTEGLAIDAADQRTPIEEDVEAALRARGLRVTPRLGLSERRIDIALEHPDRHGVHVLAVELDGPRYWAAPTVRDRDRLRREHLERLGWSHARVWALEWYLRREAAVERILDEWRAAAQRYDMRARGELVASGTAPTTAAAAPAPVTARRASRPPVPPGRLITAYSQQEIWLIVDWVLSDGLLRTDDEIVEEVARELAFPRVEPMVDWAIRSVVRPPG